MFIENHGAADTSNTDLLVQRRKTPRCILGFEPSQPSQPLKGVRAVWDDRTDTEILNMSLSGIVLAREGTLAQQLDRAKRGQTFQASLRFEGNIESDLARQNVTVRIMGLDPKFVFGMFDSVTTGGRPHLSQDYKDQMVINNWRRRSPLSLDLQFQNSYWFHGPFDTNLIVTSDTSGLLEYDGLFLKWGPQGSLIFKSNSSGAEKDNYSALWTCPPKVKVVAGSSWKDRWIKLMEAVIQQGDRAEGKFDERSLAIMMNSLETVKAL
jgi:hypothetical protein